ncbi:hypothetical protein QL285_092151 [Trifolium repens]|nr:hypothetical protein QL285_092151 [Trifolium repens]
MIEIATKNGDVHVYVDNGPNYVLRPANLEEVDDNGHCEVIRQISAVGLENENDVHSEIFGHGYYSENGDVHGENGENYDSDDSVREIIFDEEESDAHGGLPLLEDAPQSPPPINYARQRNVGSTSTIQGNKNTKKDKEITKKDKGKKPVQKKKGRPKKDVGKKLQHEYFSDDSDDVSLYDERDVAKEMNQNKVARGLSDDEYATDELVSDYETDIEGEVGEVVSRKKFATFVQPKNVRDYKWEEGTYFVTKKSFTEAVRTYSIHSNRMVKFVKNDKRRIRGKCQGAGCNWEIYSFYLKDEETWQLRKVSEKHDCPREPRINLLSSDWLSNKLQSSVKENPTLKVNDIVERTQRKWSNTITKGMAYRAREKAFDLVNGSFREQYTRLHDYAHELLKTNPGSTVVIAAQDYVPTEADVEAPERPICPHFQRMYVCLKACKESFLRCRPIIGLDGCFLKGYYGGQLLAAICRDPNDQMLPIAYAVVEGETRDSWTWFLQLLINDLGGTNCCSLYTFISDQQKGLLPAIDELLPGVDQRFCVRHLYNNFRKRFPGKNLKLLNASPAPANAASTPLSTAPVNASTPPTNATRKSPRNRDEVLVTQSAVPTRKSPRNRDEVLVTQPAVPTRKSPRNREELPATQPAIPTRKSPIKRKRAEATTQPAPATRKSPIKRNKTELPTKGAGKTPTKAPTKAPPKEPPKAPPKAPFKPPRSSQKPPFKP